MDAKTKAAVERLDEKLSELNGQLAKFQKDFAEVPWFALEWGDALFEAAARQKVYREVRNALAAKDTKATLATVRQHALEKALNGAKNPKQSTGVCNTLMSRCETMIWAELADVLWGPLRED